MTTQEFAAKVRAKYPGSYDHVDDKTLTNAIVAKHPEYKSQIDDSPPSAIASTVGAAAKAAVMPLTAPATFMAGQDPTQLPDETTVGKAWKNAGIPEKGLEGLATGAQGLIEGQSPQNALQNASNVTQGTQAPPKVAGFLAGALDPRGLAIGEALNPLTKGLVSAAAGKLAGPADWMASRVMQYSKKLVGNQFARGMADSATEFANAAHPEIQQAIMDVTQGAAPKAEAAAASAAEGASGAGESLVKAPAAAAEDAATSAAGEETGLAIPEKGLTPAEPEGPILEGDVVGGPEGAEYDPKAPVGEETAPEGIDSLGRPTISASAGTEDMYTHVDQQLKVVGDAIKTQLNSLTDSGQLWDPKPVLKQLETMYHRNASGAIIPPWDFSAQGEYNQAVSKVINSIKARALDNEGVIHDIPWQDANELKGVIQKMANYTKPKFAPENMVYSTSGATVREAIDNQAAKVLSQGGQDIQPFQALRGAYSKLKVLEESLNNKFAGELSAKSSIPVLRTASAGALLAAGKPLPAAAMMSDYLIRKYGPQVGAQMLKAISDNAGGIGAAAGNVVRSIPPAASAVSQGLQGE